MLEPKDRHGQGTHHAQGLLFLRLVVPLASNKHYNAPSLTVTNMRRSILISLTLVSASAYQPSQVPFVKRIQKDFQTATATAALASTILLGAAPAALASNTAAQISLNTIPPTSIRVDISDLPVIGNVLSGTYTKVADLGKSTGQSSITISSPKDKVKAVQDIATGGHLEFDVNGALKTHLDVDISADEPGVAKIRVASNLIPKLPFKNMASASQSSPTGGKPSAWNMVTNMGSGESYYYNEKSGVTQYERPGDL